VLKQILKQATLMFIVLALLFGFFAPVKPVAAADPLTITVNEAGDSPDAGNTTNVCETSDGNGVCTLRAAIEAANSAQSIHGTRITFNIPRTTNLHMPTIISIGSALPALKVTNTTIEGPNLGASVGTGARTIVLDGGKSSVEGATRTYSGIEIRANNCAVKKLTISDFGGYGIVVGTSSISVTGITITGNKLGNLMPFSIIEQPNFGGIKLVNTGSSLIGGSGTGEGNTISGNTWSGIRIEGGGTNLIQGNYIGVNSDGTGALPNDTGIYIVDSVGNTIGGDSESERNIISGNTHDGVDVYGNENDITGNYIGTDPSGTLAIPNGGDGVRIGNTGSTSNGNQIGGLFTGQGNLISGNLGKGIEVYVSDSTDIFGNTIGLTVARSAALPNNFGITLGNCTNTEIGAASSGASNTIAGNTRQGIFVEGTDTENTYIKGNYIGVNSSGASFPNGMDGITVQYGGFVGIGGTETGARNVIANNGDNGVELVSAYAKVEGNSIYNNAKLGIDVIFKQGQAGVTPNDFSEADNVQNFPGITSVSSPNPGTVLLQGQMTTTPQEQLTLYFYGNDVCDPSGYGEGQVYLGLLEKSANASGQLSFSVELPNPDGKVNFTASTWGPTHGNSEFSPCRSAGIFPPLIFDVYLPAIMK